MRRKLIQHGPSTLTVSLPYKWIKGHNLKKGNEVECVVNSEDITILPVKSIPPDLTCEVSLDQLDESAWEHIIMGLHTKGYDKIKILTRGKDIPKKIYKFLTDNQLGFEILKQEKESITIQDVSNPTSEKYPGLLRRAFRIVIEY